MNIFKTGRAIALAAFAVTAFAPGAVLAQDAPFGNPADTEYAAKVWAVMGEARLTPGDNAIYATLYEGTDPHGFWLETFYTEATIDGHTGALVVKRNYGPEGVEEDVARADPKGHLGAITVMFKREAGYDDDNNDWFWAKYLPDGSLDKNPANMQLAGRVAKGAEQGCIACHTAAPGEDYIFTSDHIQ